jgi:hypothetical protein
MAVKRQYISANLDYDGTPWCITVARPFVASALARRQITDAEFFDFVDKEFGTVSLLAKRKIRRNGLTAGRVMLDRQDLPD